MIAVFKHQFDTSNRSVENSTFEGFYNTIDDFKCENSELGLFYYIEAIVNNTTRVPLGNPDIKVGDTVRVLLGWFLYDDVEIIEINEDILTVKNERDYIIHVKKKDVYFVFDND